MGLIDLMSVGVLPGLAALLTFFVMSRLTRSGSPAAMRSAASVAMAAGICVGYIAAIRVLKVAEFVPSVGWNSIPWMAAGISLIAGVFLTVGWGWRVVFPFFLLTSLIVVSIAIPVFPNARMTPPRWVWVTCGTAIVTLTWWSWEIRWKRIVTWTSLGSLVVFGTTMAIVLGLTGNRKLASIIGFAVAAACGTALSCGLRREVPAMSAILAGFFATTVPMLLVGAAYSGETSSPAAYGVMSVAPLIIAQVGIWRLRVAGSQKIPSTIELAPMSPRRFQAGEIAEFLLTGLLCGGAIWLAWPIETW